MSEQYSSGSYSNVARQLRLAMDDAPGGEKAWVPIRRSLAAFILEHLEHAEFAVADVAPTKHMLRNVIEALKPVIAAVEPELINLLDEPRTAEETCNCAACKELEKTVTLREPPAEVYDESATWETMNRQQRIECIQTAVKHNERPAWMPDKRAWKRHYPEAFAVNGGAAHG